MHRLEGTLGEITAETIRAATADDVDEILTTWAAADAEPTVTDDRESLLRLLDHDPNALLVAESDDRIVGTLIATWDGWRASMARLTVLPDQRRQGLATALVERAEQRFQALGAKRVATFVVTTEARPARFWAACGYQAQTERRRFVKNLSG